MIFSAIFTNTEIDASVEKCWQAFFDVSQYQQWNPLITQVRGKLEKGQQLQIYLRTSSKHPTIHTTQIKNIKRNVEFRCLSFLALPLLFDCEYVIQFESISKSRTLLKQWVNFSGLLVPFFIALKKKRLNDGLVKMNNAFKRLVETR